MTAPRLNPVVLRPPSMDNPNNLNTG
jgi:hypothetical protein